MEHGKWHLSCCGPMILKKALWLAAALALVLAWVASAKADGMVCFGARDAGGKCASGLPVAHLFWDALILGVLSMGLKKHHGMGCGTCDKEEMK